MAGARMKLERGLLAALGGAGLLLTVVVWRLARASYPGDIAALCEAERLSGFAMDSEPAALYDWIRGRLATPEGQALFTRVGDAPIEERGAQLRTAAAAVGLRACAMADVYDRMNAAGACRADVQLLCSLVTFPGLADDDDDTRAARLEGWLADGTAHPCAGALAGTLRDAPGPVSRAALLRAAAKAAGVFTCDIARVVESPRAVDAGGDAAVPDAPGLLEGGTADGGGRDSGGARGGPGHTRGADETPNSVVNRQQADELGPAEGVPRGSGARSAVAGASPPPDAAPAGD